MAGIPPLHPPDLSGSEGYPSGTQAAWRPAVIHSMSMAIAAGNRRAAVCTGMTIGAIYWSVRGISNDMMDILPTVRLPGTGRRSQVILVAAFADISHGISCTDRPLWIFAVDSAAQQHDVCGTVWFVAIKAGEDKIGFTLGGRACIRLPEESCAVSGKGAMLVQVQTGITPVDPVQIPEEG